MERKALQEYAVYNTRRLNTPPDDEMIGFLKLKINFQDNLDR